MSAQIQDKKNMLLATLSDWAGHSARVANTADLAAQRLLQPFQVVPKRTDSFEVPAPWVSTSATGTQGVTNPLTRFSVRSPHEILLGLQHSLKNGQLPTVQQLVDLLPSLPDSPDTPALTNGINRILVLYGGERGKALAEEFKVASGQKSIEWHIAHLNQQQQTQPNRSLEIQARINALRTVHASLGPAVQDSPFRQS